MLQKNLLKSLERQQVIGKTLKARARLKIAQPLIATTPKHPTTPISPKSKFRHDDYTVGWICALPVELAAAQAILDDVHADLPIPPSDHNTYTLGRIGVHNTVIACLPSGIYGTASATSVVNQMLNSFRYIRFGLIVGIGGGAPSENVDIRLGDIVISKPTGRFPGVVQYDFGKTIKKGHFEPTGILNKPPQLLLTAVAKVEANHRNGESQVPTYLSQIRTKMAKTSPNFIFPDRLSDQLFHAEYDHFGQDDSCENCDKSKIISREPRETGDPKIHCGLIASGNQVMKHGGTRDRIAREHGILCFEMEAAGLMDSLPCLAIRGISDYADTHKNNLWQGYAAATSAAYAKEILSVIHGERSLGQTSSWNTNRLVARWLSLTNFSAQQINILQEREEGTGQWLLDSPEYQEWIQEETKTLFCPGIPGAGKTMMSSIVVDSLRTIFAENADIGIACLFCSYKKQVEQTSAHLAANIVKQLIQDRPELPSQLKALYDRHKQRDTRPSFHELAIILQSVINSYSRVFLVIDAIDECAGPVRAQLLRELFRLQKQTRINVFATSRHNPGIIRSFGGSSLLEIRASTEDLERYIDHRMTRLSACVLQNSDLQQRVKTGIVDAAGEMFLLAQLHLKSLEGLTRPKSIINALQMLPKGSQAYDEAYAETMTRIEMQKEGEQDLARNVLAWITCARRPLTIVELQDALAVDIGASDLDLQNIPELEDVVSVCAGLVTIDEENHTVNLVHYTAQQYLERTLDRWFPNAQNHIAKACVTYLSFDRFGDFLGTDMAIANRQQLFPLYDYAARNWGHHAREGSADGDPLVLHFLKSNSKVLASSQVTMAEMGNYHSYHENVLRDTTGLHLAAYFGLTEATLALLDSGQHHDVKNTWGQTPLWWASTNGHHTVVEILLSRDDIDLNPRGIYYLPERAFLPESGRRSLELPLADKKHSRWVKFMGAQTPLWSAAEFGHEKVVALLLSRKSVDPNFKDWYGQTPFSRAAANGHEAVVRQLLVKNGADPNSEDKEGQTALSWASKNGHATVVKQLLEEIGADINHRDHYGQTPLFLASANGHEEVVRLLLADDAIEVNTGGLYGQTPLFLASANGHTAVAKLLLMNKDVDPNLKDSLDGRTPLLIASSHGYYSMVKLLLEHRDTDINVKGTSGRNALWWAAANGYIGIVDLLLSKGGIDYNDKVPSSCGQTPLLIASENGHERVVQLLLEKTDVDCDSKDLLGQTPLSHAARNGHAEIVRQLALTTMTLDVNSKDRNGLTPLSWAARRGHEEITRILTQMEDIDLHPKDIFCHTPLSWAAENGHEGVIKIFLEEVGCQTPKDAGCSYKLLHWPTVNEQRSVVNLASW